MLRFIESSGFKKVGKTKTRSGFVRDLLALNLEAGQSIVVSKADFSAYGIKEGLQTWGERTIENGPSTLLNTPAMKKRGYKFSVHKGLAEIDGVEQEAFEITRVS